MDFSEQMITRRQLVLTGLGIAGLLSIPQQALSTSRRIQRLQLTDFSPLSGHRDLRFGDVFRFEDEDRLWIALSDPFRKNGSWYTHSVLWEDFALRVFGHFPWERYGCQSAWLTAGAERGWQIIWMVVGEEQIEWERPKDLPHIFGSVDYVEEENQRLRNLGRYKEAASDIQEIVQAYYPTPKYNWFDPEEKTGLRLVVICEDRFAPFIDNLMGMRIY